MQRRRKAHSQPARQSKEDRKSILLWRSALDSPDKKCCPLKSWSKHYEEARMMKKSQIIWHKWGKLPFKKKKKVNRGFVQPRLSQGCLVSLALSKSFAMQWTCLSFSYWYKSRIVQAAMQLCPPDLQLVPKWTYAELQQAGVWQQKIQITLSNCIVCHIKRMEFPLEFSRVSTFFIQVQSLHIMGSGEGKEMGKP